MDQKNIQTYLLIVILAGSLISFTANPYQPSHSIYNESWNGTSWLRYGLEREFGISTSRILVSPIIINSNVDYDTIVIIGSERRYTDGEINAYEKFVNQGGNLVIFEDYGPAKRIANKMGIGFFKGMLRETNENFYVNRPSQFFVRDLVAGALFDGLQISPLVVSEAVGLIDSDGMERGITYPLLMTYPSALLDLNNNQQMDADDIFTNYGLPVALFKYYGLGTLTVVGDEAIPLNQYFNREFSYQDSNGQENYFLASNLYWSTFMLGFISSLGNSSTIVFDESHQASSITSAAGLLNLIAGSWVSIINTIFAVIAILTFVGFASSVKLRKRLRAKIFGRKNRRQVLKANSPDEAAYISRPNYAEKSISEQYILYQVFKDRFLHIANNSLLNQIIEADIGSIFIKTLENEYGKDLSKISNFDTLLEIHTKLRDFVDKNKTRLL